MSDESEEVRRLTRRMQLLEERLAEHSSELNSAIDQRDNFALTAIWGPIKALLTTGVFFGGFIAGGEFVEEVVGWHGVLAWITSFVIGSILAFVGLVWVSGHLERGEEGDRRKLWKLPEWQKEERG